jgi:hypothetical protein
LPLRKHDPQALDKDFDEITHFFCV